MPGETTYGVTCLENETETVLNSSEKRVREPRMPGSAQGITGCSAWSVNLNLRSFQSGLLI